MELREASILATALMNEHGLLVNGWTFAFDNAVRRLGQCRYGDMTITISRHFTAAATGEQVRQAVLHEIAHALTGYSDHYGRPIGHGDAWKRQARAIGYDGKRTAVNPHQEKLRAERIARGEEKPRPAARSTKVQRQELLKPGNRVVLTYPGTKYTGQELTIVKPNRTRYVARHEPSGALITVPFGMLHS